MNNILCLKWGSLYGVEFVNTLYAMFKRHLTIPFRFCCITDDAKGIYKDVDVFPLTLGKNVKGWWHKISFFQKPLYDIEGTVLTIDLDMAIVDNIDELFTYKPGKFLMVEDRIPLGNNSSVMRFQANEFPEIYDQFIERGQNVKKFNTNRDRGFKSGKIKYWGDQAWITEHAPKRNVALWPRDWIVKYGVRTFRDSRLGPDLRKDFFIPKGCKVMAFHGANNSPKAHLEHIGRHWNMNNIGKQAQCH